MDIAEIRLELLKLAKGGASFRTDAEAIIKAARSLEEFVIGRSDATQREREDSERH